MENLLDDNQQKFLLGLARYTVEHYLEKMEKPTVHIEDETLKEKRGAFVTFKINDQLRGCIGYPLPYKPLYKTVMEVAVQSATQDPRFQSLTLEELPKTKIEISVLGLPHAVDDIKKIKVGKHGIIISKGPSKGLLLPQVAVEWNWSREEFLNHGCLKAGLDEDEWKKGVQIEIFSAQVFSE